MRRWYPLSFGALAACAGAGAQSSPPPAAPTPATTPAQTTFTDTLSFDRVQYVSTYRRRENPPVLLRNANVLTGAGPEQRGVSVLFQDGKIAGVGANLQAPSVAHVCA